MCWEPVVEKNLDRGANGVTTVRGAIGRARRGAKRVAPVLVVEVVEVRKPRERRPVALERGCLVIFLEDERREGGLVVGLTCA